MSSLCLFAAISLQVSGKLPSFSHPQIILSVISAKHKGEKAAEYEKPYKERDFLSEAL